MENQYAFDKDEVARWLENHPRILDWTSQHPFSLVVAILILIPVLVAMSFLVAGITIKLLWLWFVVPAFHVPAIGFVTSLGLSVLIHYLTNNMSAYHFELKKGKEALYSMALYWIMPLLMGWIIHLFL